MSQRTLRISALATLLLVMGGVSAQADEIFTVRIENVSAKDALKLSNGKTEPVGVAPVLYLIHTNRAPLAAARPRPGSAPFPRPRCRSAACPRRRCGRETTNLCRSGR